MKDESRRKRYRSLGATLLIVTVSFLSFITPALCQQEQCVAPTWTSDRQVYRVGVLATRGLDAAFEEFNTTFNGYLTATAGARFDPPIRFEMTLLDFSLTNVQEFDFLYTNPFIFSCAESEIGAHSLVAQVTRHEIETTNSTEYGLTKFGGVIFTRANSSIETVEDIRGKTVACTSIWGLGSGQAQFRVLQEAGLSYINDPRQMVFTFNEEEVVKGVLRGDFDVGFVRTGQLERMNATEVKIIEPRNDLSIDGVAFPFQSSTQLYPEWNVAALTHVPNNVALEVQQAMLAMGDHAAVGFNIFACYAESGCDGSDKQGDICRNECEAAAPLLRCDTTVPIALTAHEAMTRGRFAGFRPSLSYMELRNLQEETQFIEKNQDTGIRHCVRSFTCPDGYYERSEDEVENGCASAGLVCGEGFQCLCSPCVERFEVDVFPLGSAEIGCPKLAVCGATEQRKELIFHAVDNNKNRAGLDLRLVVRILEGKDSREIHAHSVNRRRTQSSPSNATSNVYEFTVESNHVGVLLLEIFVDGEHTEESPLRVEILARDCAAEFHDDLLEANFEGRCVCKANSVDFGGNCISYDFLLPAIILPLLTLFVIGVFIYIKYMQRQADSIWSVKLSELFFDDPPEIIGRGTFGLVLLAEYRGTQVAVKRVIPPRARKEHTSKRIAKSVDEDSHSPDASLAAKQEEADHKLENGGPEDASSGSISISEFVDEKSDNGNVDLSVRSQDQLPVINTYDLMPRSRSMGHYCTSGLVVAGSSGLKSMIMPRRHSADCAIGGSRPLSVFNTNVDREPNGKAKRRKSVEGAMSTAFDIEDEDNPAHDISYVSLADTRSVGSASWTAFASNFSDRKSNNWWSRRREYSRLKADFVTEMRQLSKLRHPCVTTVMGAVVCRREEPMLVMEYMDHGSLYDILHNETMILEGELVLPILRDITCGVRFLHAACPHVIHGDLKAHNVLVDSKFRAKVSDFGLTLKKGVGATGTPFWMAPELLRGESDNTAASDVFSFGIILYEVYSRTDPYTGEDMREVIEQVADPTVNKRPPVPPACPPMVASLMSDCLVCDPAERPNFKQLDLRLKNLDVLNAEPGKIRFSRQSKKVHPNTDLLDEVFPEHVAKALREGRKIEPESRDCVTIFFSDIVGFTTIASILSPMKVSDMLDRLYLRFDMLSLNHDVFKVETIGDAYMAATNLVKDQDDHVKRIAEFAIDTVRAANETLVDVDDPSKGFVKIRVGFHSGPVVANVVGSRCPRYSLFGDSVNTAARMESTSKKNRIQCSDRSAGMLVMDHPEIRLASRGLIKVKGKGEIHTFWVNEDDNEPSPDPEVPRASEELCNPAKKRLSHKLFMLGEPENTLSQSFTSGFSTFRKPRDTSSKSFSNSFSSLQQLKKSMN
jgi:serine/threonine protein kinase